jgi:gliding motility-associated-like protein
MIKKLLFGILTAIIVVVPQIIKAQIGVGPAPYCMPLYFSQPCNQAGPSNSPGNGVNDFIHSYNTAGGVVNIANNNSGCNSQNLSGIKNYRLWGCEHYLRVTPGQFITSNFQSGNTFPQGCAVFVDWNNDGIFNAAAFTGAVPGGERVTQTPGVPPAAVMTPMPGWTVPNVPAGVYRMRVRCAYFTNGPTIDPCITYGFGETEDYFVYCNMAPNTATINLTSNSPVCLGSQVQINTQVILGPNSGTCAANTYTYSWTGPMSFTSNVMNPTFTATNVLQSGIYTLNITPPTGCGCGTTNTIQIWVNPNPSTSITNNGPVCQGSTLNFSNTIAGSGTLTYTWTGPNNFVANTPTISFANAQPSASGNYSFIVVSSFTNGGQCVATSQSSAAVVPLAQVSTISQYTQCQGTTINLNSSFTGTPQILWQGPNGFTSNLQNPTLNGVTPLNSGDYTVTTTFTSQTTTLTCSSFAVSNVSVVPQNPVSVTPPINICQGGSVVISATAASNPTYNWYGPTNIYLQQQSIVFNGIQPFVSGNYVVNAVWSIGSVSCTTSNTTSINVIAVQVPTVVPQITICNGESTALTATANSAISYTWTGPNNFSVTQPVAQFQNLTPNWSGIYTVTAAFSNNNLTCYSSNTTNLLVKPNIQFTLSPINKLCYGQNLTILGPNGASSYSWTGPGFSSTSQNLNIPSVQSQNVGNYNLALDLNGCKTSSSVFVDVLEPIKWKFTPNDLTLCKGDGFTITALPEGGSGNYAYNWNPYYNLTGPTGSVQTGIAQGTTFYGISVYDIACPTWTINHQFKINVNEAPNPNLNLIFRGCEPFCQNYSTNTGGISNIIWNFGGNNIYSGDQKNICLPSGDYTLNVTSFGTNGCKETFNKGIINVYPKPDADFSWNPNTIYPVSTGEVIFSQIDSKNSISWFWEFGSLDVEETPNPTRKFEFGGNYPVTLVSTNKWGCKDTVTKTVKVDDELLFWLPDTFSPNGDGLNDTFKPKGTGIKSYELYIFDRWGSVIFIGQEWDGQFKGVICQDGVYVYKLIIRSTNGKTYDRTGHVTLLK